MSNAVMLPEMDRIWCALARSEFRSRFALKAVDRVYLERKGFESIMEHARGFLEERLFPAHPRNDGKQTPMRGHPVFLAQHATATCCRGCLEKWHHIPRGRMVAATEQEYVLALIAIWLRRQVELDAEVN